MTSYHICKLGHKLGHKLTWVHVFLSFFSCKWKLRDKEEGVTEFETLGLVVNALPAPSGRCWQYFDWLPV